MGDPHNPARIGEIWNPYRWHVLATEIEAIKEFGALSGGWAWHFMSPPHQEEKHLHDHRDIDLHVFPDRFSELVVALQGRGYRRQATRFDDPSGEFVRFEKYVEDACFKCYKQALIYEGQTEPYHFECAECGAFFHEGRTGLPLEKEEDFLKPSAAPVKVIFDLFVHAVPTIEANGYTVVEPKHMLTFYGIKHSSEQCVAVQAARQIQKEGGEILGNSLLVGDWAL